MLVIGTAGHIDHGKSALVKALTGTDPDRLKEEQARGITIDLGFAHAVLGSTTVAFVDVPGHERFVRNMLAGAGGIDAVLMVVAADESVMPQTREHFEICRLLGIEHGLVALTKSDIADDDTLDLVKLEVRDLVAHSFLSRAPIVPVSARTGAGLDDLRRAISGLAGLPPRQARAGVVRLPIDRVFSVKGFGTVVTGTLVSGTVAEGDVLTIFPDARPARVRGIQVHGQPASRVDAPARAALNLGGIEVRELSRGMTLGTEHSLAVTQRFDARLELVAGAPRALRHGARVRVHHGTSEISGRVAIAAVRDKAADPWRPVRVGEARVEVHGGGEAYVRVRLERPAVLTRGDRIVLRAYSPPTTIGGAIVLDPEPPRGGLRRTVMLDRFERIDVTAEPARLTPDEPVFGRTVIAEAGSQGLEAQDLVRRGGADPVSAARAISNLVDSNEAVQAGSRVFQSEVVTAMEARIGREVAAFHRAHPIEAGIPREALRELVARGAPAPLFERVLTRLTALGELTSGERVALRSHQPAISARDVRAGEVIVRMSREAGLVPPDGEQLRAAVGLSASEFDAVVRLLVHERQLTRVGGLLFHPDVLSRLRAEIQRLKAQGGSGPVSIDVGTFKERFELTRKYAIPLLEWLDRERVTRRIGERRIVI